MITFKSGRHTVTLSDEVKDWTFEQLETTFKGKLDYKALAKELGIKPTKKAPVKKDAKKED